MVVCAPLGVALALHMLACAHGHRTDTQNVCMITYAFTRADKDNKLNIVMELATKGNLAQVVKVRACLVAWCSTGRGVRR